MDEMIKKLLIAILVVLIVNTVFVATLLFNGTSSGVATTSSDESESAEEVSEYDTSKMESIDYDRFKEIMNEEGKSIVLFARSTCGYCVKFMPILNNAIEKNKLKVYYLDVTTMNADNVEDSKNLEPFADGIGTPTLLVVGGGNLIANNVGYVEADGLDSFLKANEFIK